MPAQVVSLVNGVGRRLSWRDVTGRRLWIDAIWGYEIHRPSDLPLLLPDLTTAHDAATSPSCNPICGYTTCSPPPKTSTAGENALADSRHDSSTADCRLKTRRQAYPRAKWSRVVSIGILSTSSHSQLEAPSSGTSVLSRATARLVVPSARRRLRSTWLPCAVLTPGCPTTIKPGCFGS